MDPVKVTDRPRFDVKALRARAGEKTFARGEEYHRDGQVVILSMGPERVLARVAGTENYRTELRGTGAEIGGACSCPAFADWGFCKHMVAVALAANALGEGAETPDALARIRDHLKGKGIDALVDMVVELAEQDPALFRRLDMAAAATRGDDETIGARLREAIDSATDTGGYVAYREAPGWAAEVNAALDAVADLASGARAGLALDLVERAIDRIEEAAEGIDDSDGHCGGLLERAEDIHLAAAQAARPEPVEFARRLFTRETEGSYGRFGAAAALYDDVLGEEGLREYRRLATEAWERLPARSSATAGQDGLWDDYHRLMNILDVFAEREGDLETRIALRAKDLSSPWAYLRLAEFCRSQGREEEALRRAEEGLWLFEDARLDERLVFFAVDLLSKAARQGDAAGHLWRAFEKAPGLELYARLRALGGDGARDRALASLEGRLVDGKRTLWGDPAELLIRILVQERMFDAAWAAVRKHGVSAGLKESLARESEATHAREALETYAERVDQLVDGGGNRAYEEAARLVTRMAALRSSTEQAAYVAALTQRFGRRRNFMRLLH